MRSETLERVIKSYKDRLKTFRGYCREYKCKANLNNYVKWAKKTWDI